MKAKLEVLISTYAEQGLRRVADMTLPAIDGLAYLVSCQSPPVDLPSQLQRDDVTVVFSDTKGLSNNRNNTLSHMQAPYAIIADDDLVYYADGLRTLMQRLDGAADMDLFTFKMDRSYDRIYPQGECRLKDAPKGYCPPSFEIGFRTDYVRSHGLSFTPLMGIGAEYLSCGEEDIFVFNALRKGARALFLPITVGAHPSLPTLRTHRPVSAIRAAGAAIYLMYPYTLLPRMALKAKRLNGNIIKNLYYLSQGVVYAIRHKRALLGSND